MKLLPVVFALLLSGCVEVPTEVAAPLVAAEKGKPVVTGSGVIDVFENEVITFDINIHSFQGAVSGTANWVDNRGSYTILVDCVTIVGNEAWISGTTTDVLGSYAAGSPIAFRVLDSKDGDLSSVPGFTAVTCGEQRPFQLNVLASGGIKVN